MRWTAHRFALPAWSVTLPIIAYLILVLAGATQSSIGISLLREDPAHPTGTMIGTAEPIRSDEYNTSTPLNISVTASGSSEKLNPLTAAQGFFTQIPSGPVSSVVLFDGAALELGKVLPGQMLFAARWWLPFLLLFLGAPPYFRALTGNRWIGYFAAALITFSPSSAWWSFSLIGILGPSMAGAAAMQHSARSLAESRRWRALAWGLTSAVLLARVPLQYQPWAIVIAPAIVLTAVAALLVDRSARRANLIAVGATGVAALLLLGGVVLENLASIRAAAGTVYPGSRVATGSPNAFQKIFGATNLAGIKDAAIVASNQSEISSSFAVAAVLAILLLVYGVRFRTSAHRAAAISMVTFTAFWFSWCMIDYPSIGKRIPILNIVTSGRATNVLGYLSIVLLCIVLPAAAERTRLTFALLAAGATTLVAAYAGAFLRAQNLPDLSVRSIWVAAILLAAVVFALAFRPRWWGGYVAAGLLAFGLVWNVNPILFGLGDLHDSAVAKAMLHEGTIARADHTVWATDNIYVDDLLTATAVPSLSSRQLAGPDHNSWAKLDPTLANENVWNRGGSYITFTWTDAASLTFSNPTLDVISISGSPCAVAQRFPELTNVVAAHPLDLPCLAPVGTFQWSGTEHWRYAIDKTTTTG